MMDLRYALRSLRSTPVFTSVAVLTLAVGIGANITIFSIVNGVLLRPLNYGQPDELVAIFATERVRGEQRNPMSPADFLDLRASSSSIDLQTAAVPWSPVMTGRGSAAQIQGLKASAGLFDLLGVAPALGRTFAPGDREAVGGRVVVLSHGLWLREFGGAPGAVGEVITLEREPYTVVGVMPAGFEFPPFWATGAEFWAPLDLSSSVATERRARYLRAFGRLRSGVSVEAARAEVEAQAQALEEAHPESNAGVGATVESLHEPVVGPVRPALVLLAAAVGFVLLVACANVANLLLARGAVRRREIAIRRAIGATRGRIARLLFVESLALALMGGAAGLLVSTWSFDIVRGLAASNIPRLEALAIDGSMLWISLGISLLTGLLCGLVPAVTSPGSPGDGLRNAGRQPAGRGQSRAHGALVVAEIALAVMLLVGAGLMLRSFLGAQRVDPGFRVERTLTMTIALSGSDRTAPTQQLLFHDELLARVRGVAGVEHAGLVNHLPFAGDVWRTPVTIAGRPALLPAARPVVTYRVVTPDYFGTMGIPILRGRDFDADDGPDDPGRVIVNRRLAQRMWPGEEAVGKRLRRGGPEQAGSWATVVGVVGDVRQQTLTDDVVDQMYFPYPQNPDTWFPDITLVVETRGEPLALAESIRSEIQALDPSLPVLRIRSVEQLLAYAVRHERLNATLVGVFAVLALGLALVGIYGVVSFLVGQRTHEIGLRLALGAEHSHILGLIVGRGLALAAGGVAAGVLGALTMSRFLESLLFRVDPADPLTLVVTSTVVVAVAALACYVPARRALRIDPIAALRE